MHCETMMMMMMMMLTSSLGLPIIVSARYYNHPLLKDEKTEAQGLTLLAQDTVSRGSRIFFSIFKSWFIVLAKLLAQVMIYYAHWLVAVMMHLQVNKQQL